MILKRLLIFLSFIAVGLARVPGTHSNSAVTYKNNTLSTNNKNKTSTNTGPNSFEHVRIIGGVETLRNEFPFIVTFARHGKHFCGGSIIAPDWVLTASHCASESESGFAVTAGDHDLYTNENTEQVSTAIQVIRHPHYNPVTYEDDICLVKVSPPFVYNEYVKPFAVPSTHFVATGDVTVAGWGTEDEGLQVVSPVLRKVTVPLVSSMSCVEQYGQYFRPTKMMCAGLEEGGKDACQGDSGGPLMCDDHHKGATLCGVVSFGLGCARPELAGVYTKVSYYSDWIAFEMRKNTGKGGPAPPPPRATTKRTTPFNPFLHGGLQPTPAPPPQIPGGIPPGYIVIIKPQNNNTYVPAQPATPPPPPHGKPWHREKERKSDGSVIRGSILLIVFSYFFRTVDIF